MQNILALNNIAGSAAQTLHADHYQLHSECADPDAMLIRSFQITPEMLTANVKAIARAGAGTNNIPVDVCAEKGIVVFNTPGANANAVKELVIAGMLLSSRKIVDGIIWANGLKGQTGIDKLVEKGKAQFVGPEILGKKLGVIGLGAVGALVANAAVALGMEVYGSDPYISVDAAWNLSSAVHKAASVESMLAECDYVTIHAPYMAATKNMFNAGLFGVMKDGARLLNFARGELVETAALKEALESGKLSAYVTDFPNDEVINLKNVIFVPHLGASTPEAEENCASMAALELKNFLEHGNIKNSVNYPDCEIAYTGKPRVCIAHKNQPNIVASITAALGSLNINIDNMLNKSKGTWAYTLIDADDLHGKDVAAELKALENVVSVRVIA